jgi:phage terminase large subunit-like protein
MAQWEASSGDWKAAGLAVAQPEDKVRPLYPDLLGRFIERRCFAGVDLSMTTDFTAVSLVFDREDGGFDVLPFFWLPEAKVRNMQTRLGVPLRKWADEGWLELVPGEVIDYRLVQARLEWASRMFNLQEIGFDPWNSRQISVSMIDAGYRCEEVRQGFATLSEPSKKLLELVASGRLNHGGNPVLRWNASCATVKEMNDNLMFTKPERNTSANRIDGIAATVNALRYGMAALPQMSNLIEVW